MNKYDPRSMSLEVCTSILVTIEWSTHITDTLLLHTYFITVITLRYTS